MERTFTYRIPKQDAGMTIYDYLKKNGYSHAVLVHLKKTKESILRNGIWDYMNTCLAAEDTLTVHLIEQDGSPNLVINKDKNTPIHPSMNHYDHTLANAVAHYYAVQGIPYTFRCANRLDRDTTGLTVLAKHLLSSAILNGQVSRRELHREYLAIVCGAVPESGVIDAPIARKEGSTIERVVSFEHGERAITHYRRLACKDGLSLVHLVLETGRTHQIRVHMKYIGHPLIGDFLYNPDFTKISRQALHSYRLTFHHPITGKPLVFTAPLPPDMLALFPDVLLP